MKRKLIAIMMTLLMLLGTVGCSTEGLNLYQEMEKVSAWEAAESKGGVDVAVEFAGQKVNMSASFNGFVNTKDQQGYIQMTISQIEAAGLKVDTKLSPVEIYIDKETVYISKTYFTDLFAASGAPIPEKLKDLKAGYIGINAGADTKVLQADQKDAVNFVKKLFADSQVKMPVTQKGREYTIALDSNQMTDLSVEFIKEIMNNVDELNKISDTGMTQKEVDAQKAEIEAMLSQGKAMVKPMIDGSKFTYKTTFEDNKYKQSLEVALKIKQAGEEMTANMTTTSEAIKITKKAFELPVSRQVYTVEEFAKLIMPVQPVFSVISTDEVIEKNKQVYIPLRNTMNQLGIAVNYNTKTKKASVVIEGKDVVVSTIDQKGTYYIALSQLSKIGLQSTQDKEFITVFK